MLCFSDYILAQSPWAYCRLNESVGIVCYNDLTPNNNHLYSQIVEGEYVVAATNQINTTFIGDPGIAAIQPLEDNRVWGVDQIIDVPDTALRFRVPEFKSDTHIYRNRARIQNSLDPLPMWIDFQWSPHPDAIIAPLASHLPLGMMSSGEFAKVSRVVLGGDFDYTSGYKGERLTEEVQSTTVLGRIYEPFLYFGSLVLVSETTVRVNVDGSIGHGVKLKVMCEHEEGWIEVWSRTIVSLNPSQDPEQPFSNGMHRFVMGIEQPTSSSINFKLSIDGSVISTSSFSGFNFNVRSHISYSRIALLNKTAFSSVGVFFRTAFPSQEWIDGSQETLTNTYRAAKSHIATTLSETPLITKHAGSLVNLLDTALFIGNLQEPVMSLTRTGETIKLQITDLIPPVIPTVGSDVTIGSNHRSVYDGCWIVTGITQNSVTLVSTGIKTESVIGVGASSYTSTGITILSDTTLNITLRRNHKFRVNDIVTLGFTSNTLTHTWRVASSEEGTFTVDAINSPASMAFSGGCILKKMPVGGGAGWSRSYTSDNLVSYTPTFSHLSIQEHRKLLVKNINASFGEVCFAHLDDQNRSMPQYFITSVKNTLNRDPERSPWVVFGDYNRFYLMVSAKQNIISQSQVLAAGEIKCNAYLDVPEKWDCLLLAYTHSSPDVKSLFNFAFLYPYWTIDSKRTLYLSTPFPHIRWAIHYYPSSGP